MKTELFDYDLPEHLIAFHPPEQRDGGRLLVLRPETGALDHRSVTDLPGLLPEGALLVANDTRVIPARIDGRRPGGGRVELLLVREVGEANGRRLWTALARANKPLRQGATIDVDGLQAEVVSKSPQGGVTLSIAAPASRLEALLEARGRVPLPPYIRREPVAGDRERYQTVYARAPGSVAAPTAGLHFTPALLERLSARGFPMVFLTLHVGPGTFLPVRSEELDGHAMEAERYTIGDDVVRAVDAARRDGRPVIAIGTTVTRALEGAFVANGRLVAGAGETDLFIRPGFPFRVVDGILTNFHLPRSTLLCLVSALAGRERILEAYREAVRLGYRFYSYGDAMLIRPRGR